MGFNYSRLWKKLIDNGMKKTDLVSELSLSPTTLSNLSKDKNVSMDTLDKLCSYFNCDIEEIVEHNIDSYKKNKKVGTFQLNKDEAIHRWFSYIEGYSKSFVKNELDLLGDISSILDPFGGSGTTMLVACSRGIRSYYTEVNPAMSFIAEGKINTVASVLSNNKLPLLNKHYNEVITIIKNNKLYDKSVDFQGFEKYFENSNLQNIILYKNLVSQIEDKDIRNIMMVALASVAVDTSKMVRRGDLRFAKGKEIQKSSNNFIISISNKIENMIEDIEIYSSKTIVPVTKLCDDAREIKEKNLVDAVITSPPYLNGTNYFRNTKLELKLLDFINYESELAQMHAKGIVAGINGVTSDNITDIILDDVKTYYEELLPVAYDRRIPLMISNYFYDMNDFFKAMYRVIVPKGKMIIDIGDSQFAGVHIPTHDILEKLAYNAGFDKYDETILRSRTSKNGFSLLKEKLGTPLAFFMLLPREA